MSTINNESIVFQIKLRLCTQFTTKKLGRICWWSSKGFGNICHVDNDSFDTIAFAFNLGQKPRHFIAVERIRNISVNVESHGYCDLVSDESLQACIK